MVTRDDWTPTYPSGFDDLPAVDTPWDHNLGNNLQNGIKTAAPISANHGATTVVFSRTLTGDTWPWLTVYSDKTVKILDGATDPSTVTGDGAALIVRGLPDVTSLQVQSANDSSIHTVQEWTDHLGALIAWMSNVGGLKINDDIQLVRSVFGPTNFYADIYGYLALHGSMIRRWVGPPGNALDYPTATGELFQGSRAGSIGTWTGISGATTVASVINPFSGTTNPGESFNLIQLTQSLGTTAALITGQTLSTFIPCVPGNYVKAFAALTAAATSRTWTATLQFYNSSATYLSGVDIAGSGIATGVGTSGWVQPFTGGVAPASSAGCALKLSAPGLSLAEINYLTAAWISVDNRTTSAADSNPGNVWNAPFVAQNNGTAYGYCCNGDQQDRIDDNGTSGHRIYRVDAAPGYWLPRQVGAPGSTSQPRWVSVL